MDYEIQLQRRTQELELKADSLRQLQEKNEKRRTTMIKQFHTEITAIDQQLHLFENDLTQLARTTKKFITSFQHVAMQGEIEALQERADAIPFHEWITKNEFEKIKKLY